jgi:hypothetical protein
MLLAGLAGFYIADDRTAAGGCGAKLNLDNIPEKLLMFGDKVLDSKCQLLFDTADSSRPHYNSLFGDINTISGKPWPRMKLQPKPYRFRLLNSGISRPCVLWILLPCLFLVRACFRFCCMFVSCPCEEVGGCVVFGRALTFAPRAGTSSRSEE